MTLTSIEWLRRKKYNVFYALHFSFLFFYLFAWLHTPQFQWYGGVAMFIYGFDKLQRFVRGILSWRPVDKVWVRVRVANPNPSPSPNPNPNPNPDPNPSPNPNPDQVEHVAGGSILRVSIKKPAWSSPQLGQYVFLNFPSISKWEWHPYTLASSPLETHYEVDIKILGDLPCPNPLL